MKQHNLKVVLKKNVLLLWNVALDISNILPLNSFYISYAETKGPFTTEFLFLARRAWWLKLQFCNIPSDNPIIIFS